GERVVQGLVGQPLLSPAALGDVANDPGDEPTLARSPRRERELDREALAVAPQTLELDGPAHHPGLARAREALEAALVRVAQRLGHEHGEAAAHDLALLIAEDALCGRVPRDDVPVDVGGDDGVGGGLSEGPVALLG